VNIVMAAEEYIEWLKLPHDLQAKFFQEAESESDRIVKRLKDVADGLLEIKPLLQPHFRKLGKREQAYTVSAVDSSRSPQLSERLGARYGVFASGSLMIRGLERLHEEYAVGVFKRKQAYSSERSRYFFDILATYVERKLALESLNHSDLVLVDGSFYGFLYSAVRMIKEGLLGDEEKKVVNDTFQATNELIESKKAIGVIKRSHSRAIGGWLAVNGKPDNPYTTTLDRFILSYAMPGGSVFYYDDLLGEEYPVLFYTRVSAVARMRGLEGTDLVDRALDITYDPFKRLELDSTLFNTLARLQARPFRGVSTCEIEYPRGLGVERVQAWLEQPDFFSDGTGLPIALDLVDSLVNIPAKFTDEFVAEVEARVVEKLRGQGAEAVKLFFSYLNPQKPF